jgi:hypothetical protein
MTVDRIVRLVWITTAVLIVAYDTWSGIRQFRALRNEIVASGVRRDPCNDLNASLLRPWLSRNAEIS